MNQGLTPELNWISDTQKESVPIVQNEVALHNIIREIKCYPTTIEEKRQRYFRFCCVLRGAHNDCPETGEFPTTWTHTSQEEENKDLLLWTLCNCHTAHKDDTRLTTQVINPSNQTSSLRIYLARDLYFYFIWFCKLSPDLMSVRQGNTIELYFQHFQIPIFV